MEETTPKKKENPFVRFLVSLVLACNIHSRRRDSRSEYTVCHWYRGLAHILYHHVQHSLPSP